MTELKVFFSSSSISTLLFAASNNVTLHLSPLQSQAGQIGSLGTILLQQMVTQSRTLSNLSQALHQTESQIMSKQTDLKVNFVIFSHFYYQTPSTEL